VNPSLGWNVAHDVDQLLVYPFMVHALEAGTIVAVLAGVVGWFMVLRQQAFAGHTLSVIAFPGAAGASLAGAPALVGYLGACTAGGLALSFVSLRGDRSRAGESAAIGSLQALALGLGFLFVSLYHGVLSDLNALLFGTFLGITQTQVVALLAIAVVCLAAVALAARPLLFASLDPGVAEARGVRVALLSTGFLVVLGLAVAATSQITGALLVFALLVTPAAAAQLITARPVPSLALTVALALAVSWLGLAAAYYSDRPAGFTITSLAFAVYVAARLWRALARR
jgi:zinc/manganese transport system permease protein